MTATSQGGTGAENDPAAGGQVTGEVAPEVPSVRACFAAAARGFVDMVRQVAPGQWGERALGTWDVRDLVGHTSRSLSSVGSYLVESAPEGVPFVDGPVRYYLVVMGDPDDPADRQRRAAGVAERGREAGVALGPDPAGAVGELALDALALVDATSDDAPLVVPAGAMTLAGYLPTRTFELTVHTLDLADALGLATPGVLGPAISACCELAGQLAARRPTAPDLLLMMTGRRQSGTISVL